MKCIVSEYNGSVIFSDEYAQLLELCESIGFDKTFVNKLSLFIKCRDPLGAISYPSEYGLFMKFVYIIKRKKNLSCGGVENTISFFPQPIKGPDTFQVEIKGDHIKPEEIEYVLSDVENRVFSQAKLKIDSITWYAKLIESGSNIPLSEKKEDILRKKMKEELKA